MGKQTILSHAEAMELVAAAQKGDEAARERLVEGNTRLVWKVVQRFRNRGYELDDLFQIGVIGLLKGINKFNMEYEVRFTTYAVPMIIGEIQRFIRDDGAVKVSRTTKEIANKIRYMELLDKTPEEIAQVLDDVPIERIKESIQYIKSAVVSVDETVFSGKDGEDITLGDQLAGDVNGFNWLEHIELRSAIEQLEPRDRKIVELRFFKDFTQTEAASELRISQVQISRLEKKILEKMKRLMEDETMASYTLDQKREAIRLLKETTMTYAQINEVTHVPTPTVGNWAKQLRDPKVTAANKRKGQLNTNKGNKAKKEKPVETPVINEPAFMGELDKAALAEKQAKKEEKRKKQEEAARKAFNEIGQVPEINLTGTTTGRFQSDVPNKSVEPKTVGEAVKEFEDEVRKKVREELRMELKEEMRKTEEEMRKNKEDMRKTEEELRRVEEQLRKMYAEAEPGFIKVADVGSPYKEIEIEPEPQATVTFTVDVSFGGQNVTRDQAVESLYEAYNLVKRLPTETINLAIVVKN